MLKDYILARHVHKPHMVQISRPVREVMQLALRGAECEVTDIGAETEVNVPIDVFWADYPLATVRCKLCHGWHPIQDTGDDGTAKETKDAETIAKNLEHKNKIIFSARVCSNLWTTINDPDFRAVRSPRRWVARATAPAHELPLAVQVVNRYTGEGAWKELMRLLKMKRTDAYATRARALRPAAG
jgi:hypothetical protein